VESGVVAVKTPREIVEEIVAKRNLSVDEIWVDEDWLVDFVAAAIERARAEERTKNLEAMTMMHDTLIRIATAPDAIAKHVALTLSRACLEGLGWSPPSTDVVPIKSFVSEWHCPGCGMDIPSGSVNFHMGTCGL
jgi:hypothetical protein